MAWFAMLPPFPPLVLVPMNIVLLRKFTKCLLYTYGSSATFH
jgi:hypothetical protein